MILVTRQEWGSRTTVIQQSRDAKPEAYVHHVAGRWPTSPADEEAHMRELQRYAIEKKQYVDLDYSWLIGPSGRCYEGRGMSGMAAATRDRNAVSRAVCLMGNLDTREPSAQQIDVLPHLLAEMVRVGSLMARVAVLGHYENPAHPGATACPGRFMKPYLPAVRARLDTLLHPSPPTTAPPMSEEDDPMNAKIIAYDGAPDGQTRAEALMTFGGDGRVKLRGFDTPAQRQACVKLGIERVALSAAEYDGLLAWSTS